MKSKTWILTGALLVMALIAGAAPAHATEDRFSTLLSPSYGKVSEAPYSTDEGEKPDWRTEVSPRGQRPSVVRWYGPSGGPPAVSEPDIILETLSTLPSFWPAGLDAENHIVIGLNSAFPKLTDSLGTTFTTGRVLLAQTPVVMPIIELRGDGVISARRPARDCSITDDARDPDGYNVNIRMFTENGHAYLVNVTFNFGLRTWEQECASAVEAQALVAEPEADDGGLANADAGDVRVSEDSKSASPLEIIGLVLDVLVLIAIAVFIVVIARLRPDESGANDMSVQDPEASRT